MYFNNKKISKALLLLTLLSGLVFSSCSIHKSTQKQFVRATADGPYDVVVVPGAPVGDESLSSILSARIYWAKYLFENGFTKNIIFSGAAVNTPYIEGLAMKMFADSLGIPSDHTFAETKAEHSTENIYYGVQMARQLGFKKIALASDPFQTMMLASFMKKKLNGVGSVPIVFRKIFKDRKSYAELPHISVGPAHVDENEFIPLYARENFFKRLSGTFGNNIPELRDEQPIMDNSILVYSDSLQNRLVGVRR